MRELVTSQIRSQRDEVRELVIGSERVALRMDDIENEMRLNCLVIHGIP